MEPYYSLSVGQATSSSNRNGIRGNHPYSGNGIIGGNASGTQQFPSQYVSFDHYMTSTPVYTLPGTLPVVIHRNPIEVLMFQVRVHQIQLAEMQAQINLLNAQVYSLLQKTSGQEKKADSLDNKTSLDQFAEYWTTPKAHEKSRYSFTKPDAECEALESQGKGRHEDEEVVLKNTRRPRKAVCTVSTSAMEAEAEDANNEWIASLFPTFTSGREESENMSPSGKLY